MKTDTMNVSLPSELSRFVRERVKSGGYASASEVVREALRLLAAQQDFGPEGMRRAESGVAPSRALSGANYDRRRALDAMRRIREIAGRANLREIDPETAPHEGHDA
jgi:antitoxin ParD1/3/4